MKPLRDAARLYGIAQRHWPALSKCAAADRPRAHRASAAPKGRGQDDLRRTFPQLADQHGLRRDRAQRTQGRLGGLRRDDGDRRPSQARYSGSKPSSSHTDCTESFTGICASDRRTLSCVARASSCATVASPPRVGSRMKRKARRCHQRLRLRAAHWPHPIAGRRAARTPGERASRPRRAPRSGRSR